MNSNTQSFCEQGNQTHLDNNGCTPKHIYPHLRMIGLYYFSILYF